MKEKESQALLDVWEWKDHAYQEVAQLPTHLALDKRLRDSLQTVARLGLMMNDFITTPSVMNNTAKQQRKAVTETRSDTFEVSDRYDVREKRLCPNEI